MQSEKPSDLTLPEKPNEQLPSVPPQQMFNLSLTKDELGMMVGMIRGAQIPGMAAEIFISLRNKVAAEVEKANLAK